MRTAANPPYEFIMTWIKMIDEVGRFYTEFFDIFYRFAIISQNHAKFLIQKNILQQMLKFFNEATSENQKFDQETEDLQELGEYFGSMVHHTKEATQHYDELLERKMEKSYMIFKNHSRVYLWKTIAHLVQTNS